MRILIIEDEAKVSRFLQKGFEAESFSVDVAVDGEKGSFLARSEPYDVIVLDVMLPRRNGIEVLRDIRKAKIETPVLILTVRGDLEDRVEGLNLGADDYLVKPFAFSELLARVRAIIRRKSTDLQASILSIDNLHLNVLDRRVERGGREIILTNKEYELLEYLLRNKGRVLSRTTLTEHSWDINFDSETNIVDVVISRLRRKIDDGFSTKLIHTVRGVGYILKESADEDLSEN